MTSHDRTSGYFVSPREFEEFQRIKAGSRRVISLEDLPPEIFEAIQNARMDLAHDRLNALMDH